MYMPSPKRKPAPKKTLRWRANRISLWRDDANLTQQDMADRLTARGLKLDRVSVTRIENGKQMPTIEILEAMADILQTDVTSMTNYTPAQAKELSRLHRMDEQERERLLRGLRAAVGE